jgi:alkylation response protein AidB-like acyl-CoA dehydrogenase
LAAEQLGRGDLTAALGIMAPGTYVVPILMAGSEEQKSELIQPVIEGDWQPYTAAFLEPDFDFDPGQMRTTATADNGSYLIEGEKALVPFAPDAQGLLAFATLDGSTEAFVIAPDAEGIQIGEREKLLGIQALPTYPVSFKNVRVSQDARLPNMDFKQVMASFQVAMAALAVGLSRAAFEYSLEYAKQREAFGTPIAQKQAIAFMLAEMASEIDGTRLMVWEAAWEIDQVQAAFKKAYLAYTGATDTVMMVTDRAVQILGGHGYIREHPVERWMRNGRGVPAFNGLAIV